MPRVIVVFNPVADRGRAAQHEDHVVRALKATGCQPVLWKTERPGDAVDLARRALKEGADAILAAGGDGTAHEVGQALVGTKVPLGILPIGSGNDYIRVLGIPKDLGVAAQIAARTKSVPLDVAEARGRFALNSMGMGIEGQIAWDYKNMRVLKGEIGYLYATLWEVVAFRSFRAEVKGDGWSFSGRLLSVSLMNGPYAGGGFHLAPFAQVDDGKIDATIIGNYPRLARFFVLPKTRDGSYVRLKRVKTHKASQVVVQADRALPVHMDGELLPERQSRLEVTIRPKALHVLVP